MNLSAWRPLSHDSYIPSSRRTTNHERRNSRAFSLLEMLLAISVFLLLSGAVLGAVLATLRTSAGVAEDQRRQESLDALSDYWRKKLACPSPQTRIGSWYPALPSEGVGSGWVIRHSGGCDVFAASANKQGGYDLRTASVKSLRTPENEWIWRTLLTNLSGFSCQFQGEDGVSEWTDHWQGEGPRPGLVEAKLWFSGEPQPVT